MNLSSTQTKCNSKNIKQMKNNQKHIYLVDGSTYIFRAYHALPPLTRKSDGFPVGAISGFCNMLDKLIRDEKRNSSRYCNWD